MGPQEQGNQSRRLLSGLQVPVDKTEVAVVEGGEEVRSVEGSAARFASRLDVGIKERQE